MKKTIVLASIAMTMLACNHQNPLLTAPANEYGVPEFSQIQLKDYKPAFEAAIKEYADEIDAIVNNEEAPTFQNTVAALDRSGLLLERCEGVFFNVLETDGNDEMNALAEEIQGMVTEVSDNVMLNDALFARIKAVYEGREAAGLTGEQLRLTEETYRAFVQNGAELAPEQKERLKEINQELAALSLKFGQNVVAETNACQRFVTDKAELEGLPESALAAAAEEAEAAGHRGEWLFTPKRTSFTPVLQYCTNRAFRKTLLMDYTTRGNHDNENDNKSVINQTMRLRTEKAHLFGFECAADYILQDAMAHDGKTAYDFLYTVWEPSLAAAKREAAALQELLDADIKAGKVVVNEPEDAKLQPWDWWFYAEQLRASKYAVNEEELKPYFELKNVRQGAFNLANRLYGISITPIDGIPVYNKDCETFKVTDENGELLGIFITDYFPRATKRPGAWMNNVISQYIDDNGVNHRPVIVNVGNFNKPTADQPALLSMDDVETLFHEFGHALHGFLSQCTYKTLSGTSVPRDFVELPSQVNENWCYAPEVMKTYAFHYATGEVIPDSLIEKINAASKFNQGFVETELLSASILDLDYHLLTEVDTIDVNAFEAASMAKMQMIPEIITRYRSTFYNHIFTTGYEAGYYSYTWSAVLDADAFHAFVETGDIFDKETAMRFRNEVLSKGNTADAAVLYNNFRGKPANPDYLLERKGLK
ncbi:MAG: M3 family metallopeptidase [Bacteroidales bacterium]|nr:M3 family metallopeptidase [Candidatus Colicola faecequi]